MEDRQRVYTVVAVVAVVAIALSCLVGAAAGAVAGLVVGQAQGRNAAERVITREYRAEPEAVPVPRSEESWPAPMVEGAVVREVTAGTPAEEAGLLAGDVIVALDRTQVDARHDLSAVLGQYRPGDRVTLRVWRGGQETTRPVVLGEHPSRAGQPYLGIRYQMTMGLDFEVPND